MHALARTGLLASSAALLLLLPGCLVAAVAVGAAGAYGYIQYDENEAWRDFPADVDDTWNAAMAVLHQQGYPVDRDSTFEEQKGRMEVGDVDLRVTANSSKSSRVAVRVGTFKTDESKSKAGSILESMADRLD